MFLLRDEDLDFVTSSPDWAQRQHEDLAAMSIRWSDEVVRQSERFALYRAAISTLEATGVVYPCFCSRREIRAEIEAATRAPHSPLPLGAYPGTCRELSVEDRAARMAEGRQPAFRLRTDGEEYEIRDRVAGVYVGAVDDVVLARADGVPAYNLAVVVDDALQGVTEVVRGDDLLSSTPRQVHLQRLLGYETPEYAHIPLVCSPSGSRLAKRDGAVTLRDLYERGVSAVEVRNALARSFGCDPAGTSTDPIGEWATNWSWSQLPTTPVDIADLGLPV